MFLLYYYSIYIIIQERTRNSKDKKAIGKRDVIPDELHCIINLKENVTIQDDKLPIMIARLPAEPLTFIGNI